MELLNWMDILKTIRRRTGKTVTLHGKRYHLYPQQYQEYEQEIVNLRQDPNVRDKTTATLQRLAIQRIVRKHGIQAE